MQYPDVVLNYVSKLFNGFRSKFQHFYTGYPRQMQNSNVKHQRNDTVLYPATWKYSSITKSKFMIMKHSINVLRITLNVDILFYLMSALYIFNTKYFNTLIK